MLPRFRKVGASLVWWRAPTTCFILSHDSGAVKSYQGLRSKTRICQLRDMRVTMLLVEEEPQSMTVQQLNYQNFVPIVAFLMRKARGQPTSSQNISFSFFLSIP